ncbi:glycoside hydrolase family 78 protein [Exserohilum turcica Et28A]|uniref:Glycoside hydrolase family 78 protein n=1 Tax=Exserohilum turcicum (strain 28A) TaxID=671987 RepID=R0K2R6_EXST2|nr:glycoside hydrolase family 78 protein [Exserohilum turcica Et28A]EOA87433.1 glycoside hydrolase family 78 protein [Exserohilum turcica Et28A]
MRVPAAPLLLLSNAAAATAIPYEEYILAPKSRVLHPVSVHSSNGSVTDPASLTTAHANGSGGSSSSSSGSSIFTGAAATAYDFGINIAGPVSLAIGSVSSPDTYVGVTFTESSLWISNKSSDATADAGLDETLYMTLVHNGTGSVEVAEASVEYTAMPHWSGDALRNYTGYFHCDDELLNRIWYAGAYTNQLCTTSPDTGNALVELLDLNNSVSGGPNDVPPTTWYYDYTVTKGSSTLVDGAKRDRLVWAGDMAIAVPAIVVSTNDVVSVENALNSLFAVQNKTTGVLPYAGRPFFTILSFTYHLYTLIGVADHYLYTGDLSYLRSLWDQYKLALSFSINSIDSSGLMNVTSGADWLRFGMGGHNIEANAILYYTINQAIYLAGALNDTANVPSWRETAERVKTAANELLWVEAEGMYRDNETTTLMPQDGNSWAVVANLTINATQVSQISNRLAGRWTRYGAPAPEAGSTVSPFISGFELQTHFLAGNTSAAQALMRLQWGFMLDDPRMTNSTFIEGYSTTGELIYAPYKNSPRISHAHGWATGPTLSLTQYVAGIELLTAGGATWRIAPSLGDLTVADAGFSTALGFFGARTQVANGSVVLEFETPEGTTGSVHVPVLSCNGRLAMSGGQGSGCECAQDVLAGQESVAVENVAGGRWKATFQCRE